MDSFNLNKIKILKEENKLDKIIKILLIEKRNNPKNVNVLFQLGGAYRSTGNFNSALENYEEILKIDENYTPAYRLIGTLINFNQNKKYLNKLKKLKNNNNLIPNKKVDLYFALGKAYEDLNEKENSAYYYIQANKTKKTITKYNFNIHKEHLKQIYEIFKNFNFHNKRFKLKNDKKIIFICGLPRTGSTLIENIISSHKEVYSGGELPYLKRSVKKFFVEDNKLNKNKILNNLNDQSELFTNEYLNSLSKHNFLEKFITDKSVENFRFMGFINLFFSDSKIILCKRNCKATALSIYKNNFNSSYNDWTNDPNDIINYFKLYN
mgnify:CR=1 FL=1